METDFLNWGWAQRTSLMQLTEDGSGVPMGNSRIVEGKLAII
jgi:hypothetical protein